MAGAPQSMGAGNDGRLTPEARSNNRPGRGFRPSPSADVSRRLGDAQLEPDGVRGSTYYDGAIRTSIELISHRNSDLLCRLMSSARAMSNERVPTSITTLSLAGTDPALSRKAK